MDVAQRMLAIKQSNVNYNQTFIQSEAEWKAELAALNSDSTAANTDSYQLKPNPSVLIVDDSITVRELLSMTFQKAGYQVEQARDGQQALQKLNELEQVDVIICDVEMPRMNGFELLGKLREDENLSQIPVAMLTSRGAEKHRKMAAELGAKGYMTKPYIEDVLLETSKRLIAGEIMLDL
jgi:chemosensory pili system protein ChpA (sensor histidine kinase/response regulator)